MKTAMPKLPVTKRVGTRKSSATPIQKREKTTAVTRERSSVAIANDRNSKIGVTEKRI